MAEKKEPRFASRLLLTAVGIGIMAYPAYLAVRLGRSYGWREAKGKVVSSSVESSEHLTRGRRRRFYKARVVYEYPVDGASYTSERIYFGHARSTEGADEHELVKRYPAGRSVTVLYDPDDPSSSILERRLSWLLVLGMLALGALVAAGGIASMLGVSFSLKIRRPRGEMPSGSEAAVRDLAEQGIRLERAGPETLVVHFAAARHPKQVAVTFIMAFFFAVGIAVFSLAGTFLVVKILVVGILGLIEALLLISLGGELLVTRRVEVGPGRLRVFAGVGPLGFSRSLGAADVQDMEAKCHGSQGKTSFYALRAGMCGGRRLTLGTNIIGKDRAERLCGMIERALKNR